MAKRIFKKNSSGFVVLYAIMLSIIILSITMGVTNIALKEINFSSSAINTGEASLAADVGVECALFNDKYTSSVFVDSGPGTITCLGGSIPLTGGFPSWDFVLSGLGSAAGGCAKVNVFKDDVTDPPNITTIITAKGYNIGDASCNSTNPNRIERELVAIIGTSGLPGPPPPPPGSYNLVISKAGTGTGTVTSDVGGINCGATCSDTYTDGTLVTLTPTPTGGSSFAGWSGDEDCSDGSVTMTADISCTATFNPMPQVIFVGADAVSGTSFPGLPAHSGGDLIVMFAYRDGSSFTPPSVPGQSSCTSGGGWTVISSSGGGNTNSSCLAYQVAAGSGTASGVWNNASVLVVQIYRGASILIGANTSSNGASGTASYSALTLQNSDGTSWVAGFGGSRSSTTNIQNPPLGMTNRDSAINAGVTAEAAGHDTNGGISSWSLQTVPIGGTTGWMTRVLEIRAQ